MSETKSKFNIKYINTNIGHVYYRFAEFFFDFFYPTFINFLQDSASYSAANDKILSGLPLVWNPCVLTYFILR